jgi:hypothetical protein
MPALFPQKTDTLTSRNIVDSYISAYEAIHSSKPQCEFVEGRTFLVQGLRRDRHWLVLEIERLRQEALSAALSNQNDNTKGNIFRMIRRLSRI